jgi:acetyl esterase
VGDDYGITVGEMTMCTGMYLPDAESAGHPLASPLRATSLDGVAPAHILTAEFDPLREDGARYAQRLEAAGVPVVHTRHAGAVHGSLMLTDVWPPARAWRAEVLAALRSAHAGVPA